MISEKNIFSEQDKNFINDMLEDAYAVPTYREEIFNLLLRDAKEKGPSFMQLEAEYIKNNKRHSIKAKKLLIKLLQERKTKER